MTAYSRNREPPDTEAELVECYDGGEIIDADQAIYLNVPARGGLQPFCDDCVARREGVTP